MKKALFLVCTILLACQSKKENNSSYNFTTVFENSNGAETATYDQIITFYKQLAKNYPTITIDSIGITDSGKPLHYISYTPNINTKNTILINNGIHPGESDGIDATMILFRDFAQGKISATKNTKVVTIPIYNIGGCLNRNTGTRTNQNGPKEYGFRGNARNYDLNRDFIKSDTKNSKAFATLFHTLKPNIFIDNHVSNGADYQYTLTHLFTQHNKLNGPLGEFLNNTMMPEIEQSLLQKNIDITPYVNVWGTTPESGWSQFMDYPRYSTGYTTLFNCLGMMVETHMLKPYKDRVLQTYELNKSVIDFADYYSDKIKEQHFKQLTFLNTITHYSLDWKIDSTKVTKLNFKGYEASYPKSKVTNKKRLFYNRDKPYHKTVNYYNYFKPSTSILIPKSYVIPQGWYNVTDLLNINHINLTTIKTDTTIKVTSYKIDSYRTRQSPYEGHYQHYNTKVITTKKSLKFRKGDFIVNLTPENMRYLIETLEPEAPDSFFNWNFFDPILQQKEHFSPYVFEDKALEILNNDLELKKLFDTKKATDSSFSKNSYSQLDWIHKHSQHYETSHLQYPIYRIENHVNEKR